MVVTRDGGGGGQVAVVARRFGENMMAARCCRFMPSALGMVALPLLAGLVPVNAVAAPEKCVDDIKQENNESKRVINFQDWDSLYQSYMEYGDCSPYHELYSSYSYLVGRLLAKHWQQLGQLEELAASDPTFMAWVLDEKLNTRIPKGRLAVIHENASNNCPAGLSRLCERIIVHFETDGDPPSKLLAPSKGKVEAAAIVRNTASGNCSYTEIWLSSYACSASIMDKLEVSYDGNAVHVPAMAYNDIVNAHAVSVSLGEGDAYTVSIMADDSDYSDCSYEASLGFAGEVMTGRTVVRRCDPDDELSATAEYVLLPESGEYGIADPGEEAYRELSANEHAVEATVTIRESFPGDCVPMFGYPHSHSRHGGDLCPNLAEKLVVTYHGKEVHLPVSTYGDVSDVEDLSIKLIADYSMYVIMLHLDHATRFLFFEGSSLYRGIAWSDVFPTDTKQETEYKLY